MSNTGIVEEQVWGCRELEVALKAEKEKSARLVAALIRVLTELRAYNGNIRDATTEADHLLIELGYKEERT